MTPSSSGRPAAPEPPVPPKIDARTDGRPLPPRLPEPRSPEIRPPEPKAAEARGGDFRGHDVRVVEHAARASVLGPTLRFKGELSASEDLILQGTVEGSITHTQSLTVGTDGTMKGDIRARVIILDGKVDGDLYATESVTIRATAKVRGNVFAPRVAIIDGAFFQGQIEMQPSGAAVQERSARMREAALTPPVEEPLPGGGPKHA